MQDKRRGRYSPPSFSVLSVGRPLGSMWFNHLPSCRVRRWESDTDTGGADSAADGDRPTNRGAGYCGTGDRDTGTPGNGGLNRTARDCRECDTTTGQCQHDHTRTGD